MQLAEILLERPPHPFWTVLGQVGIDQAVGTLPRYHSDWRESTAEQLESLRREEEAAGRPRGPLEVTVSPSEPLNAAVAREYAELGVDRLALLPPPRFWRDANLPLAEVEEFLHANAPAELGVSG